jgi:hypothetical protein
MVGRAASHYPRPRTAASAALFVLLLPGLLLFWYILIPFFRRGSEFHVEPDGSAAVRGGAASQALLEYEYSSVTGDGTRITFSSAPRQEERGVFPPPVRPRVRAR